MNVLFLTLSKIVSINECGIYTDLLRYFVKAGHQVTIVRPVERRDIDKPGIVCDGSVNIVKVRTLNIQKTNIVEKGIGTLLLEYQYIKTIKKHLSDVRFDLLLYSTPPITFNRAIEYIKRRDSCFTYLMLKDIFPQNAVDLGMFTKKSFFYKLFRRKEKKLYQLSDFIGCMSPANKSYILENNLYVHPDKVGLCYNSIDAELIPSFRKEKIVGNSLKFIYGGNLGKPQGIDFLLQVLMYFKDRSDIEFLIIGSGTEFFKLKRWFEINNPTNAKLMNKLAKDEYEKVVTTSDVGMILLDSRFTIPNFPSRLLSYLQNGLPIFCAVDIATDIGRIAEKEGFGLSCLHGDLNGAVNKIEWMISNKHTLKNMGYRGYIYLKDKYSSELVYSKILEDIKYVQ